MFKADEIELLEKFAAEVNEADEDLYLKSLFTPEFVGWVSQAIRDDVCPDIHAWGVHGDKEALNKIESLCADVADLTETVSRRNGTVEKLNEEVNRRGDEIERLNEMVAQKVHRIQELADERDEGIAYAVDLEEQIDALETTVTRLKAELYDALMEDSSA
jgi:hypothetical protein